MSDIGTAVRAYLIAQSGVSNLAGTRVFPDVLPQNVKFPAIACEEFSSTHEHQLSGASGVYHPRVRIDCYAETRIAATNLGNAVRAEMQGYRGDMGTEFVHSSLLDGQIKDVIAPKDASQKWRYRVRQSYRLSVTESIPTF